jgi:MscS family membrane protein
MSLIKKYPKIYLAREGNYWFYSEETQKSIEDIHKQVYPFGVDKLLELAPKLGDNKYFGLHVWQMICHFDHYPHFFGHSQTLHSDH